MTSPPFCPYASCSYHRHPPHERWWHNIGSHWTKCFGHVPRYRCTLCRRSFSTQTFSINYYEKRKIDYRRLESLLASSMSIRALAREFGCSIDSVLNRIDRLSRQSLATHARLRPLATRYEGICIDGFVAFDRSQYFPNNITISITADSRFALSFTHATLRRSGTMRPEQKNRRDQLYAGIEFEHHSLERSFTELLDELERDRPPLRFKPLVIITDEKIEYRRSFFAHRLFSEQTEELRTVHRTVNSRLPRTMHNPLFASNYLDREIRKDQAAHHRESTCFGRSVANGLSRMACYLGWHNYEKAYLIKPSACERTHGEEAGIPPAEIARSRKRIFQERAFLSLQRLDGIEERIWKKSFPTPGAKHSAYSPAFALD
jgi:transposase-like protein